jgi:hypothetical protein
MKLKFVFLISAFITMVSSLDFLEDGKNRIVFEFSFTCGNSFLTNKKIISDIVSELQKREIKFDYEISSKKNFDGFFKIFVQKNNQKILLVTSDLTSENYAQILTSYPRIFINTFPDPQGPSDEDVLKRKDFIENLLIRLNKY